MSSTLNKTWTHTATVSAGRPLTEEVARDHETLKQCYEQYKAAKTNDDRLRWTNMYIWQNARHAIAECVTMFGRTCAGRRQIPARWRKD